MTRKRVDVRNKACPWPVVETRKAMLVEGVDIVVVILNNEISAENVKRLAAAQGWESDIEKKGDEIVMTITKGPNVKNSPVEVASEESEIPENGSKPVVFITGDVFGKGDAELGRILMRSFIKTLKELDPMPSMAVFANSGVKLTTTGSELIEDLKELEKSGMEIVSCGTCLDYYNLKDALQVGRATNMYEIAQSLICAHHVVKPD